MSEDHFHIFLDEGGNLTFSEKGTAFFTLTSVARLRSFYSDMELNELKFDLLQKGLDIEYFHASEDNQEVRNRVFGIIRKYMSSIRIDSLIVDKRKVGPALREITRFYPEMLGYLLRYVLTGLDQKPALIMTDSLPIRNKREAVRKAIQQVFSGMLPKGTPYQILHHASKSNFGLQIADYCNWAVFRKWESNDERSYKLIQPALKSEFNIFKTGQRYYF